MEKYSKIINLPHHVSKNRPQMTMYQRAAQFAPFAALTGHGAAINEATRLTDDKAELSESDCAQLNMKIAQVKEHLHEHPVVSVTYFVPDPLKEGGSYTTHTGAVKRWIDYDQALLFEDGIRIVVTDIIDLRGSLFD